MGSAPSQRRLVAILAADAEGFSRHMAADEAATVEDLDAARRVFRSHIEARQGRVIDMAGDSVLAVFDLAAGAVEAAWAIQQALMARAGASGGPPPMRFRIGIHLGDVIHRADGTVYGDGVNVAARIQALASPGSIVASDAVCAVVRGHTELLFVDRGEQRLKNIARPVRIHAVGRDAAELARAASAETATPSATPPRTNLPVATEALISREAEIQELGERVVRDRLTTLVGPGGIGKTRLAGVVANGRQESFPDGVWWVDLAAVSTVERVPQAVAQASGTPLGDGDGPVLLARALAERRLLLVLDNCEHVLAGVAAVLDSAARSDRRRQRPGDVAGATRGHRRAGLASRCARSPAERRLPRRRPDVRCGAPVRAARAGGRSEVRARRGNDRQRHRHLPETRRQRPGDRDGRGLGAARRPRCAEAAPGRAPAPVLPGNRSLPSRQRSLRATLDWSHSLLGPTEQQVLRRLSVFVGSIRLELAQQVASAPDEIDEWTVLEALRTLVDRSLIQVEPMQPPRYRLLESVRLYAGEQLAAAGETQAVERRHGEAFARLADHSARRLPGAFAPRVSRSLCAPTRPT